MNENRQGLLELSAFDDLCITSSFFCTKSQHKISWRHPCSKHWQQLDLIVVRRAAIKNILHTHSYHSVDWCAVRSGCNQRNSTAQRQRGTFVSMSARCLNLTSWSCLFRLSRRNLVPCNQWLCHKEMGSSAQHYVLHCFGYLWEEVLKIRWLVWIKINCDDPCH